MTDRKAFSRRLQSLLDEKGWSQSDFSRRAFGSYIDPTTGYDVAYKRDRISSWVRGKQFPDADHLPLIAKAFGIAVEDLLPPPPPMRTVTVSGYATPAQIRKILDWFEAAQAQTVR